MAATGDAPRCGHHKDGRRFDVARSSTGKLSCSDPCRSAACGSNECGYSVSYAEGSRISGHMVSDVVTFATDAAPGRTTVPLGFGCQTLETGLFNSQVADGIVGFSWGGGYGATLMDNLRDNKKVPDIFSMCLSHTVGAMVMGAELPANGDVAPVDPLHLRQLLHRRHRGLRRRGRVRRRLIGHLLGHDRRLGDDVHVPASGRVQ